MRESSVWDWAFVILFALAVLYQVLVPPVVGLPENGDFARMMQSVGLSPVDTGKAPTFTSFARHYTWDPAQRGRPFPSSELLFVVLGLIINIATSKSGLFDILSMGTAHALAYVGIGALIGYCGYRTRHPLRWLVYLAVFVLLTDVTYVAYFNSLYAEPSALIFFCGSIVCAILAVIESRNYRIGPKATAGFFVFGVLFLSAKLQNAMLGPLIALCLYLLCRLQHQGTTTSVGSKGRLRTWGPVAILAVSFAYWTLYSIFPMGIRNVNVYDSVFFEIIKNSPTPEADLQALGLDPSDIKLKGTHAWSPGVTKEIYNRVYKRVGEGGIIRFYAARPGQLIDLLRRGSLHAFDTRPGYLGNFDEYAVAMMTHMQKSYVLQPGESMRAESPNYLRLPGRYLSHSFAVSSDIKRALFVGKSWPLLLFILINVTGIIIKFWRFDVNGHGRMVTGLHTAILLMAIMQFLTCTIGAGELDLVKHLFMFDLLCDACLVFCVCYVAHCMALWMQMPMKRIPDNI